MYPRLLLLLLAPLAGGLVAASPATTPTQSFIEEMVRKHGFERARLTRLLASARRRQEIIDRLERPAEALPWWRYRRIFLKPARAEAGADYWRRNAATLARAEARYGVPAELIVAIIGVETYYGRQTGGFSVLDALYTQGFHYPRRERFGRQQLEALLLLAREEGMEPAAARGSYAGAMGRPQFIPTSYRAFAVDFDGDGRRDIWNDDADVIGSVANYFARHGWRPGEAITAPARGVGAGHRRLLEAGIRPSLVLGELRAEGIRTDPALADDTEVSLIALEGREGPEYWVGLHNFYVITRYNHSALYAMAVYQLSREILLRHRQEVPVAQGE